MTWESVPSTPAIQLPETLSHLPFILNAVVWFIMASVNFFIVLLNVLGHIRLSIAVAINID
jgi:hypothetical protein